jgi:hypothetical protein
MGGANRSKRQSPEHLLAAIPHIANDVVLLRLARDRLDLRIGWTTWYVMARNAAVFLEVPGVGVKPYDIRASQYFASLQELRDWEQLRMSRLESGPSGISRLFSDASQAAAHLSWRVFTSPRSRYQL